MTEIERQLRNRGDLLSIHAEAEIQRLRAIVKDKDQRLRRMHKKLKGMQHQLKGHIKCEARMRRELIEAEGELKRLKPQVLVLDGKEWLYMPMEVKP